MRRLLILLPFILLLAGCGRQTVLMQDAGQLLPVSALAIDARAHGGYAMTVESIRQDSLDGDAAPAYFSVGGETFDELFRRADELLANRLYLSHAQAIVVSPAVAQTALPALTESLLARPDARLTLRIAVAHGAPPDEVLRADAVSEDIPGMALAALLDERAKDGSMADCPLFRLLDHQAGGDSFSLPALRLNGDGHAAPDGSVQLTGGAPYA